MQALTLPALRGWRWISEGFVLFRKKHLMLSLLVFGYWVLMALVNSLPVVGQIAATLLVPAFSVGLMNACRMIEQGVPLPSDVLFSGFRQNLRALLMLGALYIAFSVAILAVSSVVDGGALFRFVTLGQRPSGGAVAEEVSLSVLVALVLFAPVLMAYWFAPVLAAWHGLSAGKSLFFSLVASWRNWRAFLVYGAVVTLVGAFVPGLVAGVLGSLFASAGQFFSVVFTVAMILVLLPTLYASFYVSYRDVFVSVDEHA